MLGTLVAMVEPQQSLNDLSAEQLREMTTRLLAELRHSQALNAKLTYENALLKRMKFAAQSERFNAEQRSLLDDEIEADLAAVAVEIEHAGIGPRAAERDRLTAHVEQVDTHPEIPSPSPSTVRIPSTVRGRPADRGDLVSDRQNWLERTSSSGPGP